MLTRGPFTGRRVELMVSSVPAQQLEGEADADTDRYGRC